LALFYYDIENNPTDHRPARRGRMPGAAQPTLLSARASYKAADTPGHRPSGSGPHLTDKLYYRRYSGGIVPTPAPRFDLRACLQLLTAQSGKAPCQITTWLADKHAIV